MHQVSLNEDHDQTVVRAVTFSVFSWKVTFIILQITSLSVV